MLSFFPSTQRILLIPLPSSYWPIFFPFTQQSSLKELHLPLFLKQSKILYGWGFLWYHTLSYQHFPPLFSSLFFPPFFFYFGVCNVLIEPGIFNMLMCHFTRRCHYLTHNIYWKLLENKLSLCVWKCTCWVLTFVNGGDFSAKQIIWGRVETAMVEWTPNRLGGSHERCGRKDLGGQEGIQHVHGQSTFQQAKKSGWHWRFKLERVFLLLFFSLASLPWS